MGSRVVVENSLLWTVEGERISHSESSSDS
jgi:hypothetical protein